MKKLSFCFVILSFGLLMSCKDSENKSVETEVSFDWLLGDWERTNDEDGMLTREQWNKKNDSVYYGVALTLQGEETIWSEDFELLKEGDDWNFYVTGIGEVNPTKFEVTSIDESKFICENLYNEFPKKIVYEKNDEMLLATISDNGGYEIPFNYKPNLNKDKN